MKPLAYVPGQNADADKLAKAYEDMAQNGRLSQRLDTKERDASDPFGLNEEGTTSDVGQSHEVTERLVKFFGLLREEFRLTPEAAVYAAELAFLNIMNSQDLPLTPAEVEAARTRAYEYYKAVIKTL